MDNLKTMNTEYVTFRLFIPFLHFVFTLILNYLEKNNNEKV